MKHQGFRATLVLISGQKVLLSGILVALGISGHTAAILGGEDPAVAGPRFRAVKCEGVYPGHLQGICTNDKDAIYWCYTTQLVKTNAAGRVLKKINVANHHGDLCFHDGKVYVAVNLGKSNLPAGSADSWIYAYDAEDLQRRDRFKVPEVVHGAGGIGRHDGRFIVVGGLPKGVTQNYLYEYDESFVFKKRHVLPTGYTPMGIQTAAFAQGYWWFGCYGNSLLFKVDPSFSLVGKYKFDCTFGMVGLPQGGLLIGRCLREQVGRYLGWAVLAETDKQTGFVLRVPEEKP